MSVLKIYFGKLKEILKVQSAEYFILLVICIACSFFDISAVAKWLGVVFLLTIILQSLFLLKRCYLLFIFRVLIAILLGSQLVWIIAQKTIFPPMVGVGEPYSENDLLGFQLTPNLHDAWQWQIIKKDTLVAISISSDSCSRRIPDDAFMKEYAMPQLHPDKHALFLGCSFTFGFDLMYASTFPYLFEKVNPDYKSYNYGVSGFGPHQMALLFDKRVNTINEETVPERKGFALYTYIDAHLDRVYGGSDYLRWVHCLPPNVYIENDSLVIKEWPQKQLRNAKLLNSITLLRKFIKLNYPKKEAFYKRFASIINYMAKQYWELNPDNHFYVSIYPGYDVDLNWIQYLDEKIVVLRVNPPSDYDDKSKYKVNSRNPHPSEAANVYYVEELTKLIGEYE